MATPAVDADDCLHVAGGIVVESYLFWVPTTRPLPELIDYLGTEYPVRSIVCGLCVGPVALHDSRAPGQPSAMARETQIAKLHLVTLLFPSTTVLSQQGPGASSGRGRGWE